MSTRHTQQLRCFRKLSTHRGLPSLTVLSSGRSGTLFVTIGAAGTGKTTLVSHDRPGEQLVLLCSWGPL